jgi:hypothetical protein
MSRLGRFEHYRYIGVRDTMTFYDCDADPQFEELSAWVERDDLVGRNRLQAFAPDTPEEALNRGYQPLPGESEIDSDGEG